MLKKPPLFPQKIILPILCLLVSLGVFSTYLYLPSLPAISKALSISHHTAQLTLTIFFLGFSVGSLILGPLCDRMGRVVIAKCGLILFIGTSFWCAESSTIITFLIARFVQGIAASTGLLVANAVGRDLYEDSRLTRFFSTIMIIVSFSSAFVLPLGGLIETNLGWEENFYFLTGYGFFIAFMVWICLPETNEYREKSSKSSILIKNYITLFKNPAYRIFCSIMSMQVGAVFCAITLSPFLFIHFFEWTPQEYGFVGIAIAFGNIMGYAFARYLAPHLYFQQGVLIGNFLCVLISLLFVGFCLFFPITPDLFILYIIFFFSFSAFSVINASAGAMNLFPYMACTASAMIDALQIGAGALGSGIASLLSISPLDLGMVMGGLSFLSLISGLFLEKKPSLEQ